MTEGTIVQCALYIKNRPIRVDFLSALIFPRGGVFLWRIRGGERTIYREIPRCKRALLGGGSAYILRPCPRCAFLPVFPDCRCSRSIRSRRRIPKDRYSTSNEFYFLYFYGGIYLLFFVHFLRNSQLFNFYVRTENLRIRRCARGDIDLV